MNRLRGAALGAVLLLSGGCGKPAPAAMQPAPAPAPAATQPAAPPRLRIVATFPPMYCFTKNIAGDLADVEMLVPEKGTAGYTPSRDDVARLSRADVIVENGFGFEPWLDALLPRALKLGAIRIVAARSIPPLPDTQPGSPDAPAPPNPCVWLDPLLAISELQQIRDGLMAKDPAHADLFLINENRYETALRDLDDQVGQATVALPRGKPLRLPHEFAYFMKRYELPLAPGGISNESSPRTVIVDPMESGPASADSYEQVTHANTASIVSAANQAPPPAIRSH